MRVGEGHKGYPVPVRVDVVAAMRSMAAPFAALCVLLAGCTGGSPGGGTGDVGGPGADPDTDGSLNLTALGAAPVWAVGQSWTHDWTLGTTTFQVQSIVVDDGDGYRLAASEQQDAINHAAFFFHDLGRMDASWSVHQGDYVYPWYDFPLSDGKTWKRDEVNLDFNLQEVTRELTMTARLVNASAGVPAHYAIEQRTADGGLRATYDYDASLGWFRDLKLYDPAAPGSEPQVSLHTSATATGYTGAYHEADGELLLAYFPIHSPIGGQVSATPTDQFTITSTHTHVMALAFAFAAAGASHVELVAPDGQHWEANQVGDPDGGTVAGNGGVQVIVPAVPGEWRAAFAGASPIVAGGGCFAWGVVATSGTL